MLSVSTAASYEAHSGFSAVILAFLHQDAYVDGSSCSSAVADLSEIHLWLARGNIPKRHQWLTIQSFSYNLECFGFTVSLPCGRDCQ